MNLEFLISLNVNSWYFEIEEEEKLFILTKKKKDLSWIVPLHFNKFTLIFFEKYLHVNKNKFDDRYFFFQIIQQIFQYERQSYEKYGRLLISRPDSRIRFDSALQDVSPVPGSRTAARNERSIYLLVPAKSCARIGRIGG